MVDHRIGLNKMLVIESAGSKEGLMASEYTLISEGNVFTVHRGLRVTDAATGTTAPYTENTNVEIVACA